MYLSFPFLDRFESGGTITGTTKLLRMFTKSCWTIIFHRVVAVSWPPFTFSPQLFSFQILSSKPIDFRRLKLYCLFVFFYVVVYQLFSHLPRRNLIYSLYQCQTSCPCHDPLPLRLPWTMCLLLISLYKKSK